MKPKSKPKSKAPAATRKTTHANKEKVQEKDIKSDYENFTAGKEADTKEAVSLEDKDRQNKDLMAPSPPKNVKCENVKKDCPGAPGSLTLTHVHVEFVKY